MPRTDLTPPVAEEILGTIRAGAFPLVAAEAAGVPAKEFLAWLKKGEERGAGEPHGSFARDVRKAAAAARLAAEQAIFDKDPKFWLSHGPGKETEASPGWTGERPAARTDAIHVSDWSAIWPLVDQALAQFPEARKAIVELLSHVEL
jgi:hypothetical protein